MNRSVLHGIILSGPVFIFLFGVLSARFDSEPITVRTVVTGVVVVLGVICACAIVILKFSKESIV